MMNHTRLSSMDLWTCFYAFIIIIVSVFTSSISLPLFIVYFVLAIPFIYSIEHYIVICFLFSTISYYFAGAYEEILSFYSILIVIIILRILIVNHFHISFNNRNLISIVMLVFLSVFSYTLSQFNYSNGLYRLLYLMLVSLFVGNFVRCRITVICNVLPKIASVLVLGYLFTIAVSGTYVDGRLTLENSINTNTFGMSCAQLGCILLMATIINAENRLFNAILCIIITTLALLSGSRGAILAFVLSCLIVLIVISKRSGKISGTLFKLSILGIVLLGLFYLLVIFTGLDTSRFQIAEIITSGGSRRLLIYSSLIQYIFKNGFWKFGYGPGHECSRQVIMSLIGWDYTHSHNLLLESLGELGIGGLLLTCNCIYRSLSDINKIAYRYKNAYIILAMLICLLVNGMAESYFFDAVFWLLIAICRNNILENDDYNSISGNTISEEVK